MKESKQRNILNMTQMTHQPADHLHPHQNLLIISWNQKFIKLGKMKTLLNTSKFTKIRYVSEIF